MEEIKMWPCKSYILHKKLKPHYFEKSVTLASPGFKCMGVGIDRISIMYNKLGTKVDLDNLQVAVITGDEDDEAFYGPHAITEYYAHFIHQ